MEWNFLFFMNSALLGVGLAMDAFSVSLANGMNEKNMKKSRMAYIAGVYAFFQFLMPMIGWICVHTIVPVITSKRNMFRALIIGLIMVALVFFMATSLTPLITPAVIDAGLAEAGGNYSLFNTGEHVGFLILQVLKAIF